MAFGDAAKCYVDFYLTHMRLEESEILPQAELLLAQADWQAMDRAFQETPDPLTGQYPRDPAYGRLFARIVMHASAPIGLGPA